MRAFSGSSLALLVLLANSPLAPLLATPATASDAAAGFFAGCTVSPSKSQPTNSVVGSCRGHVFSAEGLNTANPCAATLAGHVQWIVSNCRVDGELVAVMSLNAQSGDLMNRTPMAPAMAARMTGSPVPSPFQSPVPASSGAGTAHAGAAAPAALATGSDPVADESWQPCIHVAQCRDLEVGRGTLASSRAFAHVQLAAWHYDRNAVDFKGAPFSSLGGWVTDRGYVLVEQAGVGFDQLAVSATLGMRVGGRRLVAVPAASRVLEVRLTDVAPTLAELQSRGHVEMANEAPREVHVRAGAAPAAAAANPGSNACLQDTVQATTGLKVHDPSLDQSCSAIALILKNARRNGTLPLPTPGHP